MKQTCINCKGTFTESGMVQFVNDWVCANCKETFVQKMKEGCIDGPREESGVRFTSILVAGSYLSAGAIAAYIIPRFKYFLAEMDTPLPVLSRLIVGSGPLGCLLALLPIAGLILMKDFYSRTRKLPNWPFVILLVIIGIFIALGLTLPLIVLIERL